MKRIIFFIVALLVFVSASRAAEPVVLLEAENFGDIGGWVVDQQFMDQMGSPYLLAHGLGDPVKDAATTAKFLTSGKYHVWVRTRDWVAPWKAPGAPGKFQVLVDGKALKPTFGIEGADWHWQDGGEVKVGKSVKVSLHDLMGFEGRCDAILFCRDLKYQPPNDLATLSKLRRSWLGFPEQPEDGGHFDLVVTGGGLAGTCAAIAAARNGMKVALVQDRPVLGGNGSSEVRVWPEGKIRQAPYPHIGDVVAEIMDVQPPKSGSAKNPEVYNDALKERLVHAEPNITLFLENRVNGTEAKDGIIQAVIAENVRTGRRVRLAGKWFADCTGDGDVGFMAGADNDMTLEAHMGASNLWRTEDAGAAEPFPRCLCKDTNALNSDFVAGDKAKPFARCPWAVDLSDKPFPGRPKDKSKAGPQPAAGLGTWFWESGFNRDPITDVEWMRDLNLRAMYGAWDTLKNVDGLYPNQKLSWAAYVAGKRESRRLMGDVILTSDDFRTNRIFEDGCFPCSWGIDLHTPNPTYQKGQEGSEFIATYTHGKGFTYEGPYWAPYRSLYSRNVKNLFMAGRDISVTHDGLGPVRVMRTCGMMGEVVGMVASICKEHDCSPREVYEKHLAELQTRMKEGAGKPVVPKPTS